MTYIEFDFKRFYFPFQRTEDGWVFGFMRMRRERTLSNDLDFMSNLLKRIEKESLPEAQED